MFRNETVRRYFVGDILKIPPEQIPQRLPSAGWRRVWIYGCTGAPCDWTEEKAHRRGWGRM